MRKRQRKKNAKKFRAWLVDVAKTASMAAEVVRLQQLAISAAHSARYKGNPPEPIAVYSPEEGWIFK
jgi:hypothetical protein